jgi:predicted permease
MSWKRFFRRRKWDEERTRELAAHLQIEVDENISRGMLPDEARYAANRKLGNATQIREEIFHMNSIGFLEILWQDVRFGARMLRKKMGFTIAAILTLALGMGATTSIFSVVDSVLLRALPYRDASQVLVMRETNPSVGEVSVSYLDFLDWRQQSVTFSQLAAANDRGFNLSGIDQPEAINGYGVSPNFLSLLGVRPVIGRDFAPEEEKPGAAPVVMLSNHLWQSYMGADPNVVGRNILLDGRSFTVIGVLPPTFYFLDKSDVLTPIGIWLDADMMDRGNRGDLDVIGRLAPGVSFAQAKAEMKGIAARLEKQYPGPDINVGVSLKTIHDDFVSDTRPAILVLFGAVMFVLLIACANVANLYLVRGAERSKEVAIRLVFGASRSRVVRQMLTESLLLAVFGGALGLLLGYWSLAGLRRLIPADSLMGMNIRMDGGVFLFAAALIILVAVAFGLVPALAATRPDVQDALKEGGRSSTASTRQNRLRGALAVAETALALVLLVGAGLMVKSLYRLFQVSPGFQPDHVLTMRISLRSSQYSKDAKVLTFWLQTLDQVRNIPGVESAAVGSGVPFTGDHDRTDIYFDSLPKPDLGHFPHPDCHTISADYFKVMHQPLLMGREFAEADNETAGRVGLINSNLAQRFFPNDNPIGKRFTFGGKNPTWISIVGVAVDTKMYGLGNPSRYEIYLPYRQYPRGSMTLTVRSTTDPASLATSIREAIASIDKDQAVSQVMTMQTNIDNSVTARHATLVLLEMFGALALVLASIGIYGVMAYTVALRTHEIGIRMALGAQRIDVLRMVLGQGVRLAVLGVGIGIVAALALSHLLSTLLFSVNPNDAFIFVFVPVLLVLVTIAACCIPALRAMKVDPMIALRYE